jgi:hypothetical protein
MATKMDIDNEILNSVHAMDEVRQQQAKVMLRAMALNFPRDSGPNVPRDAGPKLSLVRQVVRPVIGDRLGEGS